MPAKSEAQRRFLYARFGAAWAKRHHYNNKGPLPARVGPKGKAILNRMKGQNIG